MMKKLNLSARSLKLGIALWSMWCSVVMAAGNKSSEESSVAVSNQAASSAEEVANKLAELSKNVDGLSKTVTSLSDKVNDMPETWMITGLAVISACVVSGLVVYMGRNKSQSDKGSQKNSDAYDRRTDVGYNRNPMQFRNGIDDNELLKRLEILEETVSDLQKEFEAYKKEQQSKFASSTVLEKRLKSEYSIDNNPTETRNSSLYRNSVKENSIEEKPVFNQSNFGVSNNFSSSRLIEFIEAYNEEACNKPPVFKIKDSKKIFISKFNLKKLACSNTDGVAYNKETPEFAETEAEAELYAFRLQGDEYAVVPALWRDWTSTDIKLRDLDKMFSLNEGTATGNVKVRIINAAVFNSQRNKWSFKTPGKAEFMR